VEWFIRIGDFKPHVNGFMRHIFSGLTTIAMARVVEIALHSPDMHGVWHVGGSPISKLDLLTLLREHYKLDVDIIPHYFTGCDRSLDSSRFQRYTGYTPPSWPQMISELT
jgi:dTDP-4-dehydrorhamnose reductase